MKKYCFLALLVVACGLFAKAQSGKDSVLNVITKEVCTEIGKKNLTGKTAEELQMELGLMIVPSITSRMEVLKKYYGMEAVSKDDFGQVANDIGMKLVMDCPVFMKMMSENPALMSSADGEKNTGVTITGTLQKIVPGDFTYFSVKDANGKVQKIWWMEYFEGADKLTDQMLNKPVTVTYNIKEMYNAQLKEYIGVKVATKFRLIQ